MIAQYNSVAYYDGDAFGRGKCHHLVVVIQMYIHLYVISFASGLMAACITVNASRAPPLCAKGLFSLQMPCAAGCPGALSTVCVV
jgi:hypothetical protein